MAQHPLRAVAPDAACSHASAYGMAAGAEEPSSSMPPMAVGVHRADVEAFKAAASVEHASLSSDPEIVDIASEWLANRNEW